MQKISDVIKQAILQMESDHPKDVAKACRVSERMVYKVRKDERDRIDAADEEKALDREMRNLPR